MIITIDGPSGTGKSTVAKKVAERLHFLYFDTGAMYRAFTWFVLQHSIAVEDREGIAKLLQSFDFKIEEKQGEKHYFVCGEDVTLVIRSRPVTTHVSIVSALKEVRDQLLTVQHRFGRERNVVFEGRDLGTVVFPEAEIKIFLTADPEVRAERRLKEILAKRPEEMLNQKQMLKEIMARDEYDSKREIAPLRCPKGALEIDTTHLSIEEVVEKITQHARQFL